MGTQLGAKGGEADMIAVCGALFRFLTYFNFLAYGLHKTLPY